MSKTLQEVGSWLSCGSWPKDVLWDVTTSHAPHRAASCNHMSLDAAAFGVRPQSLSRRWIPA